MTTLFFVVWSSVVFQDCPTWAKIMPDFIKSRTCVTKKTYDWEITSYRTRADKLVRERGGDALLLEVRGARGIEKEIKHVIEIEP